MHVKLSLGTAALVFAAALAAPAVSAQATSFQCMATSVGPGGSNLVIYVSQLIAGDMGQRATLTSAWGEYVNETYPGGTIASSLCNPLGTDPATQQRVFPPNKTRGKKEA